MDQPDSYFTAEGQARAELEVKRSRFLALAAHVESEDQARALIDEQRAAHPKARHHCTAFVLGQRAQTARFSDDGEPAGTAGAPILEVLTGRELTDTLLVVTRYFGGTLLGAGGLVHAYGGAAAKAADALVVVRRELIVPVTIDVDYALADLLRSRIEQRSWRVLGADYGAAVTLRIGVRSQDEAALYALIADASAGRAEPHSGTARYL